MKIISMGWKCSTHGSGAGKAVPLQVINAYVGVEAQLHSFLTSVFDGSGFSASCPGCCTRSKRTFGIHSAEDSVEFGKEKNILPLPGIYHGRGGVFVKLFKGKY